MTVRLPSAARFAESRTSDTRSSATLTRATRAATGPWMTAAARIGAGVVATAAATAIVLAPAAQSETVPAKDPALVARAALTPDSSASAPARPTVDEVSRAAAAERANRAATARQAVAARQASFTRFTLNSAETKDMRGVEKSLYRGRYFNAQAEEKRLCIVKRESEGFYDVINPGGNYFGAYQVSRALAEGVTYMMAKEHKKLMGEAQAKEVLAALRAKPMNRWSRYWQDAAFHTIMNWERPLSGASHWAGGRWSC